jgi:two-component system response regulator YesN
MDPFFSPERKRIGIEILNNGDQNGIKKWLYEEFLYQTFPYPDPKYVRTKLTHLLAQLRMHTKAFRIEEAEYRQLLEVILEGKVLYQVIQEILSFTIKVINYINNKQSTSVA